jgi:CDP-diacylglycerol--glycerol-3-phosphate 3-phosphatidyltransferase
VGAILGGRHGGQPAVTDPAFGPSALATPANVLTIIRIVLTVPLLLMILDHGPSWPAVILWIALAVSDGIDGYLARRQGATRSGAFLDPLADKVLVLGALLALVSVGMFWWLPVALVTARELGIQAFRSYWGRRGISLPASWLAKVKTVIQEVAVGFALLPLTADDAPWLAEGFLWLAVVLALYTGAQYLHAGSTAGSR